MLQGWYEEVTGRPYLKGRLFLPRLQVRQDLDFIVDTGADSTVLMPGDGLSAGLDYSMLRGTTTSLGLGGASESFVEPALLAFLEVERSLCVYSMQLEICRPSSEIMHVPSLLGRDILGRWLMVFDPSNRELTFTVHSADYTL